VELGGGGLRKSYPEGGMIEQRRFIEWVSD